MPRHLVMFILTILFSAHIWAEPSSSNNSPKTAQLQPTAETQQTAEALGEAESKTTYLICKNRASVRTLRVLTEKNGSCVTTYTKEGVDQAVGHSWKTERCSKVLANIRINLEKAQWKCKDISEARVSSSE